MFSLAGWLFTDLLLAMMMIFLAASGVGAPPPSAKPTPTPQVLALNISPFTLTIFEAPSALGNPDVKADVQQKVNAKLQSAGYGGRKVGFVLTFGGGGNGEANAKAFNDILHNMPNFQDAVFRNFHDLGNQPSQFDLEIYFFV